MGKLSLFYKAFSAAVEGFGKKKAKNRSKSSPLALEEKLTGVYNEKMDGRPHKVNWSFTKAAEDGFEASTWVYACITTWMSQVSSIPWVIRQKSSKDGEWLPVRDTELEYFLDHPNPFMDRGDILENITANLLIGGNAVLKKVRARGKMHEMWPLEQDRVRVVSERSQFIAEYVIRENGKDEPLAIEDVIHIMLPNPSDIFWGLSPLQCIAKVLDCDLQALQWWVNAVYSGCRKDGLISFKHDLTVDEYDLVITKVREQLMSNIGGRFPIIMGHESTYTPYDLTPAELDFTNSRKLTREEIAAAFKVPPPLIGILDHSTYNNLTTARRIFWVDAVIPFLERIKNTLNRTLLPEFYSGEDLKRFKIDYDISKVEALAEDFTKKLEQAQLLIGMGVPFNIISRRLELDIPEIEGGDIGYILSNFIPLDLVEANVLGQIKQDASVSSPEGSGDVPKDSEGGSIPPKGKRPTEPLKQPQSVPKKPVPPEKQLKYDELFSRCRDLIEEVMGEEG